jgi:hypothetical protein
MAVIDQYKSDANAILSKRYDLGADLWTTKDKRLNKGSPFSTLNCALLLKELGMEKSDSVLQDVVAMIFSCQREDGRFRLSPSGAIYPCHTINATQILSELGFAQDKRLEKTFLHLFDIQYHDGGWRCSKFSYGKGPETEYSNPGATLTALNAFRYTNYCNDSAALDRAVDFLLDHWTTRKPLGPCHYGIGTLFMQVEYPFSNYNLFVYTYVLSFYHRARKDYRFLEALACLESKMVEGKILVERVHHKLANFTFCQKGKTSDLATNRYFELKRNLSEL